MEHNESNHVSDLATPPDKVYDALTALPGLAGWWATKIAGDAGPAGVINFTFDGDFNPEKKVTDFAAPSTLSWTCWQAWSSSTKHLPRG